MKLSSDFFDATGGNFWQKIEKRGNQWADIGETAGAATEQDQRDSTPGEILLMKDATIEGYKYLKALAFCERQQLTVSLAGISSLD